MKTEFKFALRNIITEQFAVFESTFDESKPVELKGNVDFALNEDDRFIACTTHFEFLIDEKPFMAIQILCEFEIENDSWQPLINKKKNELEIPVEILKHLISLNIGISRGVIHSRIKEMKISFILPLINLDSLLKEPLKYKLK